MDNTSHARPISCMNPPQHPEVGFNPMLDWDFSECMSVHGPIYHGDPQRDAADELCVDTRLLDFWRHVVADQSFDAGEFSSSFDYGAWDKGLCEDRYATCSVS